MKLYIIGLALFASAFAQAPSAEYLPPAEERLSFPNVVETNFLESESAHSLADDGYRYKTVKRFRLRHRRDVNELSNEYLPPHVESAPAAVYSAPVESSSLVSAAPAAGSYDVADSEPAHSLASDGYRYKTVKRYRYRHRRDVNELSNEYLPPHAESVPAAVYSAPVESSSLVSAAPAAGSFDVADSEPAHSLASDGYRYKTVKRYRYRHRRDVNELSNEYLPPHAESAPAAVNSAPVGSSSVLAAPASDSYDVADSEPAHSLASDGYRYKTVKRYRYRHRRDVNELSNEYLPPHAESAPAAVYSAPVESSSLVSAAPAAGSYGVPDSEPAHSLSSDGYRYKTVKRYRYRHRRDVNELSNEYLPPHAESAPAAVYSAPVESSSVLAASASDSYDVADSEPAHSLASDGYRYKTVKRYSYRHRRDVNELSNEYLPPHADSASAALYSAPAVSSSSFSAATASDSYDVAASEPAHSLASDGYRYKTVKRYRFRHRY